MPEIYVEISLCWPHQCDSFTALKEYPWRSQIGQRQAALLHLATASGKTAVACGLPFEIGARRTLVIVPGKATANRYREEWPELLQRGIIVGKALPGKLPVLSGDSKRAEVSLAAHSPIIVCTVQWLMKRISDARTDAFWKEFLDSFDLAIVDEGHHVAAESWRRCIDALPNARVVFATGTPVRHDGEPLPYVPCTATRQGRESRIEMHDVARVTGMDGARYTLRQALEDKRIKQPKMCLIGGTDLKSDRASSDFTAADLDEFLEYADEKDLRVDLYGSRTALGAVFGEARQLYEAHRTRHARIDRKMTAVCKVRTRWLAEVARQVAVERGWTPVTYYGADGLEVDEDDMRQRLAAFESEESPVDMIIQVGRLTEGYNNPSICMAIPLCNMQSDVEIQQFFGRGLRLWPGIAWEKTPTLLIPCLDHKGIREQVERYVNLVLPIDARVKGTRDGGGEGPGEPRPELTLDDGEFSFNDEEWRRYASHRDAATEVMRSLIADHQGRESELVELALSGRLQELLGGNSAKRTPRAPLEPKEAIDQYKKRKSELYGFVVRQIVDLRDNMTKSEFQSLVGRAASEAVNRKWPGLRGGQDNKRLDAEALHAFLTCDLNSVGVAAVKLAREWSKQ